MQTQKSGTDFAFVGSVHLKPNFIQLRNKHIR